MPQKKYFPQNPKIGDILRILFLDHTEDNDGEAVTVEAFGRCCAVDRTLISIRGWDLPDCPDVGNGRKEWTIVRSCVVRCDILPEPSIDEKPV